MRTKPNILKQSTFIIHTEICNYITFLNIKFTYIITLYAYNFTYTYKLLPIYTYIYIYNIDIYNFKIYVHMNTYIIMLRFSINYIFMF